MTAALLAALALGPLLLQSPSAAAPALSADLMASIESGIRQEMEAQDLIGLTVAIGLDGELAWTRGFGMADLEHQVPATEHTVYRLGSISKPVTAAAVMQLVETGEIDLDAPIEAYVPDWPEKRWPVTTRQLLAHQGGIRHYLPTDNFNNTTAYATATEALEKFAADPLIAEPGTQYSYSSYGYNLLGAIVEGATGRPFAEYVRTNVFLPAGAAALQDDAQGRIIPHRARGYRKVDGEVQNSMLVDVSYKVGGGGFCGTAADLVRFAHAMQAGDLVDLQTRDDMWTRQRTRSGTETDYGLGWNVGEQNGGLVVRHGGSQAGARTSLIYFVDEGVVVAAMCNSEWSNPPRISVPIVRQLISARR